MTEGKPIRLILGIALPLMLGNVFQQLYTVVDASVVGKGLGVSALAALGTSDWFNWLFLGAVQGMAQGFTIPMAQCFGAKDDEGLRKNVGNAIVLAVLGAALFTAAAILLIQPVLEILGSPVEIRPMASEYLRVLFAGLPVVMAYNLMAGILRALGDGKSPLYAMVVASLVNIVLDLLFVLVFHWGVAGAALATVIAQACSCLFCLSRLRGLEFLRLKREHLRPDWKRSVNLLRLGMPASFQNIIISLGGMILQRVINDLGVTFIAGYTATNKLYGVLEIAAISYGYAMTTYVGQNMGAQKWDRIRKGLRAGVLTGLATAAVIAAAMFAGGRAILTLFVDMNAEGAQETLRVACEYLWTMSAGLPVLYVLYIYRSSLQGMGNTLMPMVSGLAEFAMRTGAAFVLPGLCGYWGVFFAEILAWIGADFILIPSYYAGFRRGKQRAEAQISSEG